MANILIQVSIPSWRVGVPVPQRFICPSCADHGIHRCKIQLLLVPASAYRAGQGARQAEEVCLWLGVTEADCDLCR